MEKKDYDDEGESQINRHDTKVVEHYETWATNEQSAI